MSDPVWYLYQDNQQQGPMTQEELRALADQGKLRPDSLVTRVGMTGWVPPRTVRELFPEETALRPPLPPGVGPHRDVLGLGRNLAGRLRQLAGAEDVTASFPHLRLVRGLLNALGKVFTEGTLGTADRVARQTGHLAFMAAAILLVFSYLFLGIRADSFRYAFGALLLLAPAAMVLHYLAVLFLDAGTSLLRKSPSELSSPAVLTFFALAFFAGSVFCFVMGLYGVITGNSLLAFGLWLGGAAVLLYACGVALNPATVYVETGANLSAGEEALGIVMFLVKIPIRLVPFLFGVGSLVGVFVAVYLLYRVFAAEPLYVAGEADLIHHGVLSVALLPFAAYVSFALSYLLVDVLRAVLKIPAKIEALRTDVNGGPPAGR